MRRKLNILTPFTLAAWYSAGPAIWADLAMVWAPVAALVTAAYFRSALPDKTEPFPGRAVTILIAKCCAIALPPVIGLATGWLPIEWPALRTGLDQWLGSHFLIETDLDSATGRLLAFCVVAASLTTILLVALSSRKLQKLLQFDSALASADARAAARVQVNFDAASFGLIFLPVFLFVFLPSPEVGPPLALYVSAITVTPYLLLLLWAAAASNNRSDAEIATNKNTRKG